MPGYVYSFCCVSRISLHTLPQQRIQRMRLFLSRRRIFSNGEQLSRLFQPTGVPPKTGSLAIVDWRIGFQPVREDSASRLSANESTGWKPGGPPFSLFSPVQFIAVFVRPHGRRGSAAHGLVNNTSPSGGGISGTSEAACPYRLRRRSMIPELIRQPSASQLPGSGTAVRVMKCPEVYSEVKFWPPLRAS